MSWKLILLIGTGSFFGGILRYLVSFPLMRKYPYGFPWGTLLVNLTGCLFIGLLYGYAMRWPVPKEWLMFLAVGVLGGFTTFSAFSNETITLFNNDRFLYAGVYILSSVIAGLLVTWFGYKLSSMA